MSRALVKTLALGALFASMLAGSASGAPGDTTATQVADINNGGDSFISRTFSVNGTLFFIADDGANGSELWRSDGTTATMVEDAVAGGGINPGGGSSDPQEFTDVNGTLFFAANDDTNGFELWKSVAPYTTATMIEDAVAGGGIRPGAGSSGPFNLTNVNGTLFFSADDGTNGEELWMSDGTTATMVEDAVAGGGIFPGVVGSTPYGFTNVNGTLYFGATDDTNGTELWRSVAPYTTATLVEDAVAGGGISPGTGNSFPNNIADVNGTAFFTANDGANGTELWTIVGTTATMVEDAVAGGGINPGGLNSFPDALTNVNGTLYFAADDGTNGLELWTIVGTTATLVEDGVAGGGINPGAASSSLNALTNVNGTLVFSADDGTNGEELWKADGTTATLVEDAVAGGGIDPGGSSSPNALTNVNGTLYFRASDGTTGFELWKSVAPYTDATLVEDAVAGGGINPGGGDSFPDDLTGVNGSLFFSADDGVNGTELWKTDGTIAAIVEDAVAGGGINPGVAASDPQGLIDVNGTLFFSANDGTTGSELWKATTEGPAAPAGTPPGTSPKGKRCKKGFKLKKIKKKGKKPKKKCVKVKKKKRK
jgi:ELWxxDGT repeat protein